MALPLNSFHCWSRNVNEDVSRVCTLSALTELTDADDKILKDSRYNDKGVVTDTAFVLKQVTQNWCCLFARPSANALWEVNFSEFMAYAERLLQLENLIFTDFFCYNVCVANLRENIRITHLNAKLIFLIKKIVSLVA